MRLHPIRRLTGYALNALHWLAHLSHGVLVLALVLLVGAAWRLGQGPVNVSWLTARLEASLNTPDSPIQLRIGNTAIAWEGFRFGVNRPIDLRLTDVRLTDTAQHQSLSVPQAKLSLSLGALLIGRVQPRAVELDRPHLAFRRAKDGAITLDLGEFTQSRGGGTGDPLPALLAEMARPPATDRTALRGWLSQIRRVRIHDATVVVKDEKLGMTWRAPRADIDLVRGRRGGLTGTADLTVRVGQQTARLKATESLASAATETHVTAQLSPINPAALARLVPRLAPLAAFDLPVSVESTLLLGPNLDVRHTRATLHIGSGTLRIGRSEIPVASANVTAQGTPEAIRIESADARLQPYPDGPISEVEATGTVLRKAGMLDATLALGLNAVNFADLPELWPKSVGGGARAWVTQNITSGVAQDGQIRVAFTARENLSNFTLTRATGTLEGTGLTVHWLRPLPPIENGQAQLRIVSPDTLEIVVRGGQQVLSGLRGRLSITRANMRIDGLMQPEQIGTIQADVTGSLPDALALLREPRLQLLSAHPIALHDPAGQASVALNVSLPLLAGVTMDTIAIHAAAHLSGVHLSRLVAGQSLDRATLDLTATDNGMTLKGQGLLAGVQAQFDGAMDFRAGGPNQVLQRISVSGRPDARQLADAGFDATELLSGPVPLQADFTQRRDGAGTLSVQADLTPTAMKLTPLDWRKPSGGFATATAMLHLVHDRLTRISDISVTGNGMSLLGSADCSDGRISLVRLTRVQLGRNDLRATVRLPPDRTSPIVVDASGQTLDLSARLDRKRKPVPHATQEPPAGPPWTLDAHMDRVLTAHNTTLERVNLQAANDGRVFRRLTLTGDTRAGGPFDLHIVPETGGRRLTIKAAQAGDLLRALNWTTALEGGRLTVTGTYNDRKPGHPLTATADLSDFRVREAVGLGKLLQAMTLYGLVDALRGPGLAFSHAIVPFELSSGSVTIGGARAFSSSLGLTAKGRIDLDAERVDMQGTIVPAYIFNSLLGRVPLIGRLLSPEKGGGVFAASYTLRGKLDDPDVSVNPLTTLTPGFLRGLFGAF